MKYMLKKLGNGCIPLEKVTDLTLKFIRTISLMYKDKPLTIERMDSYGGDFIDYTPEKELIGVLGEANLADKPNLGDKLGGGIGNTFGNAKKPRLLVSVGGEETSFVCEFNPSLGRNVYFSTYDKGRGVLKEIIEKYKKSLTLKERISYPIKFSDNY